MSSEQVTSHEITRCRNHACLMCDPFNLIVYLWCDHFNNNNIIVLVTAAIGQKVSPNAAILIAHASVSTLRSGTAKWDNRRLACLALSSTVRFVSSCTVIPLFVRSCSFSASDACAQVRRRWMKLLGVSAALCFYERTGSVSRYWPFWRHSPADVVRPVPPPTSRTTAAVAVEWLRAMCAARPRWSP